MAVFGLTFSPDGGRLAVVSNAFPKGAAEVAVWEVGSGSPVLATRLVGENGTVAAFSPDGRLLVVPAGQKVQVFDLASGKRPAAIQHPDTVRVCKFERAGGVLLTAAGNKAYLWRPLTGEPLRPPLETPSEVRAAALTADGTHLVVANARQQVYGWRLTAGDRPAAATSALIRLYTADDPLSLESDWQALRRDHPGELSVAAGGGYDWHYLRVNEAIRADEWQTASRHVEAAWRLRPTYIGALFQAGVFALRAGDRPAVGRVAHELGRTVVKDPKQGFALAAVELGLTVPDAVAPADRRFAQTVANWLASNPKQADFRTAWVVALGHLRAGRLATAERAVAAAAAASKSDDQKLRADVLLALVRQKQGRAADAEAITAPAARLVAEWERQGPYFNWENLAFVVPLLTETREAGGPTAVRP